jgi:hypothetical protein
VQEVSGYLSELPNFPLVQVPKAELGCQEPGKGFRGPVQLPAKSPASIKTYPVQGGMQTAVLEVCWWIGSSSSQPLTEVLGLDAELPADP